MFINELRDLINLKSIIKFNETTKTYYFCRDSDDTCKY